MTPRTFTPRPRTIIAGLFFLSGFSALVYEVLWVRMLTLVFGNTAQAAAAVMAALFAGFALGAFAGGRLADAAVLRLTGCKTTSSSDDASLEWARPLLLQLYALLELGIGLYALATPFIFKLAEWVFVGLFHGAEESGTGQTVLKVIMAFLALIVPSALMGATLPTLSKCVSEAIEKAGARVGLLYSLNTWGGVVGSFAAGFVLIPFVGVTWTLVVAALINGAIAMAGLTLAGKSAWLAQAADAVSSSASSTAPAQSALAPFALRLEESVSREGLRLWLLVIVAVSGFTSLAYEVLWTRTFVVIFGADIYAFTAVLTTFLAGIAIGSFLAARVMERGLASPGTGLLIIVALQIGIGLATLVLLPSFGGLPYVLFKTRNWFGGTWATMTLVRFTMAFLLMILPTALLGATFPLAMRLYASSIQRLGSQVGELYASNTVAAIIGSLAAGFFLIPCVGVEWSIKLTAVVNLILGGFLLVTPLTVTGRILARMAVLGAALLIAVIPGWNRNMIALAQARVWSQSAGSFAQYKKFVEAIDLPFYEEGVTATVGVARTMPGNTTLTINGKPVASTAFSDIMVERILGLLPTALSHEPKRGLVIGLGTGVTLSGVPTRPGSKVDCVEISAEVVQAADEYFRLQNHDVIHNPEVRVVVNDARHFLLLTNQRYDIITSDPIHPWAAGSVNLYTQEFYRLCRRHLAKGGVMCQWLPMYQLSDADMKAVLKTFSSVFPHTTVWACAADLVVISTEEPLRNDLSDFVRFFDQDQIATDLAAVTIENPFDVFGLLVLDEEGVAQLTSGCALVTDDRPSLEFTTPRYYSLPIHCEILKEMLKYRAEAALRVIEGVRMDPGVNARDVERRFQYVFERSEKRLEAQAARVGQNFMIGRMNLWVDNVPEAVALFESGLAKNPNDAELRHYLGMAYVKAGELAKARMQFQEAVKLDPAMDESYVWLAKLSLDGGRLEEAFAYAKRALELNPWAGPPHNILAAVYMEQRLLVKAEAELLLALAANPRDVVASKWLARLKIATTQIREKATAPQKEKEKEKSPEPKRTTPKQEKKRR